MENDTDIVVLDKQDVTIPIRNVNKKDLRVYLTKDEINERINATPKIRDKMLFTTLWMTGVRVTELINIRKKDIDFENKTIRIRWLKSRKWNERIIPLHSGLRDVLLLYVTPMKADDLVFGISRQRVHVLTDYHLGISPHQLRHSFAVHFLRSSDSPIAIVILQRLLGHKNIQTTMQYLRIVPQDTAPALEAVSFR